MSAFEWYASLVISPPIPSNKSWTLSEKVAGISQAACRKKLGQGGQEGRWTALLQTLQYHAIHARRHHAQGRAIRGRPSTWLGSTARVPSTVRQRSLLSPHPNWRRTGSRSQHCSTSNFKFATFSVVVSEILGKVNWRCNIAVFQTLHHRCIFRFLYSVLCGSISRTLVICRALLGEIADRYLLIFFLNTIFSYF